MANSAGALSRAVARMIARRATIVDVEKVTDDFVVITLEATGFRGVTWTPGEKVQIAMGSIFETRTYTPFEWDKDRGQTRILGFLHGDGPGCVWLRNAKAGDTCDVLGPRHSLNVRKLEGTVAFFGDETSLGLAYALSREGGSSCFYHFQVRDPGSFRQLVEKLGLGCVDNVACTADGRCLETLAAALPALADRNATFVLTGKGQTIQHLKMGLKSLDVSSHRTMSKAYWAPGKTGLD